MESKEVKDNSDIVRASKKRIEYFASLTDKFMRDYLRAVETNDRLGTIINAARLAQVSMVMMEEHETICSGLTEGSTDLLAAKQACLVVTELCNKNAEECSKVLTGSGVDSPAAEPSGTAKPHSVN